MEKDALAQSYKHHASICKILEFFRLLMTFFKLTLDYPASLQRQTYCLFGARGATVLAAIKSSDVSPQCWATFARTVCRKRVMSCQSLPVGITGSQTVILTRLGCINQLPSRNILRVPRIPTGITGTPVSAAILNSPRRNGLRPAA